MNETPKLNPWISMWMHPRKTMRHILDNYPMRYVHLLAIGGAFTRVVTYSAVLPGLWMTAVVWLSISIFLGLLYLYVFGALVKKTGSWLKGVGSFSEVRSSLAWSQLPVLLFFAVELILLFILKGDGSSFIYATVLFGFGIWSAIILLCCLAEAQKFSFFTAFLNYLISFVIAIAVLVVIAVALAVVFYSMGYTIE